MKSRGPQRPCLGQIGDACQHGEQSNRQQCHDQPLHASRSRTRHLSRGVASGDALRRWSGLRSGFVNRGEETVPAPRNCLNESRVVGRVAEGNTQFPDGRVDALIETDESISGPESGLQLLARNYVSGTLQKHRQDPKRLLLLRNFPPTLAYIARA
jgi:hypothetical protein